MAEFPALTLWTDAYLSDTRHLSTLEHGAYLLLLMEAWRRPNCDLPGDDLLLSRMAGLRPDEWSAVKPIVMSFWKYDGRGKVWKQKRLTKERDQARNRSKSQKDKAAKRWDKTKKDDATALPNECTADASTATATATAIEEKENTNAIALVAQNEFALEAEPVPAKPELTPEHVVEAWNKLATRLGKPTVRVLSPERRQKLKARIHGFTLEDFREVLGKVDRSAFLRGDRDWQGCNFDWITKKANFIKVLEGNYDR